MSYTYLPLSYACPYYLYLPLPVPFPLIVDDDEAFVVVDSKPQILKASNPPGFEAWRSQCLKSWTRGIKVSKAQIVKHRPRRQALPLPQVTGALQFLAFAWQLLVSSPVPYPHNSI